jgi:hypothetical protein
MLIGLISRTVLSVQDKTAHDDRPECKVPHCLLLSSLCRSFNRLPFRINVQRRGGFEIGRICTLAFQVSHKYYLQLMPIELDPPAGGRREQFGFFEDGAVVDAATAADGSAGTPTTAASASAAATTTERRLFKPLVFVIAIEHVGYKLSNVCLLCDSSLLDVKLDSLLSRRLAKLLLALDEPQRKVCLVNSSPPASVKALLIRNINLGGIANRIVRHATDVVRRNFSEIGK